MPNYSKFMKDVLTKIKRVSEFAIVALTQECSQLVQGTLPPKVNDPGSFRFYALLESHYVAGLFATLVQV